MSEEEVFSPTLPRNKKKKQSSEADQVTKKISNLFIEAQKTTSCHARNVVSISKELEKNFDTAKDELLAHVNGILAWPRKEPIVERSISFIAKMCAYFGKKMEEEENFALTLLEHLLKHCDANNKTVRFRCSEILSKIVPTIKQENLSRELFLIYKIIYVEINFETKPVRMLGII